MITEDYVSFEIAKLLKENGFDEYTEMCFVGEGWESPSSLTNSQLPDGRYSRPTIQMAMKWLRECKQLYIMLDFERPNCIEYKIYEYECEKGVRVLLYFDYVESYEQASEAAIKYCLENLIRDEN